jgi:hypothetical protein
MQSVTFQSAGFDETAYDFFDEKRITARAFKNSIE